MSTYEGPAVVVVEGSPHEAPVMVALTSSVEPGSPIRRWHGRITPKDPGSLWRAHMAGWAQLIIHGRVADFRITAYNETGPSSIDGLGPAPFS